MVIEKCQVCVGDPACENQVDSRCLPVPVFGDLTKPHLKVVTIGLNPALNEFLDRGQAVERSQRLAMLEDYQVATRADLSPMNVFDAKKRREEYFANPDRNWAAYFERMESVLTRVQPAWTYVMGSAAHIDIVACATKDRWGDLTNGCKTALTKNCQTHFVNSLTSLPNGTVILGDGQRTRQALGQLGLDFTIEKTERINILKIPIDTGWVGKIKTGDKIYPFLGWSAPVGTLSVLWRVDLANWIHRQLYPKAKWPTSEAHRR